MYAELAVVVASILSDAVALTWLPATTRIPERQTQRNP